MKRSLNLTISGIAVCALVVFWLIPALNTAKPVSYRRVYEDTNVTHQKKIDSDTTRKKPAIRTKVYKEEKISSEQSIKTVTPKMFSRAVQFEPELIIVQDSISDDKVLSEEVIAIKRDSVISQEQKVN